MLYCQINTHRRYYWRNLDPYLKHRKADDVSMIECRQGYNIILTSILCRDTRRNVLHQMGERRCFTQLINSPAGVYKLTNDEVIRFANAKTLSSILIGEKTTRATYEKLTKHDAFLFARVSLIASHLCETVLEITEKYLCCRIFSQIFRFKHYRKSLVIYRG